MMENDDNAVVISDLEEGEIVEDEIEYIDDIECNENRVLYQKPMYQFASNRSKYISYIDKNKKNFKNQSSHFYKKNHCSSKKRDYEASQSKDSSSPPFHVNALTKSSYKSTKYLSKTESKNLSQRSRTKSRSTSLSGSSCCSSCSCLSSDLSSDDELMTIKNPGIPFDKSPSEILEKEKINRLLIDKTKNLKDDKTSYLDSDIKEFSKDCIQFFHECRGKSLKQIHGKSLNKLQEKSLNQKVKTDKKSISTFKEFLKSSKNKNYFEGKSANNIKDVIHHAIPGSIGEMLLKKQLKGKLKGDPTKIIQGLTDFKEMNDDRPTVRFKPSADDRQYGHENSPPSADYRQPGFDINPKENDCEDDELTLRYKALQSAMDKCKSIDVKTENNLLFEGKKSSKILESHSPSNENKSEDNQIDDSNVHSFIGGSKKIDISDHGMKCLNITETSTVDMDISDDNSICELPLDEGDLCLNTEANSICADSILIADKKNIPITSLETVASSSSRNISFTSSENKKGSLQMGNIFLTGSHSENIPLTSLQKYEDKAQTFPVEWAYMIPPPVQPDQPENDLNSINEWCYSQNVYLQTMLDHTNSPPKGRDSINVDDPKSSNKDLRKIDLDEESSIGNVIETENDTVCELRDRQAEHYQSFMSTVLQQQNNQCVFGRPNKEAPKIKKSVRHNLNTIRTLTVVPIQKKNSNTPNKNMTVNAKKRRRKRSNRVSISSDGKDYPTRSMNEQQLSNFEEDEDLLRAQLLKSMSIKATGELPPKVQTTNKSSRNVINKFNLTSSHSKNSKIITKLQENPGMNKNFSRIEKNRFAKNKLDQAETTSFYKFPPIKPVIISLSSDSDYTDDEKESTPKLVEANKDTSNNIDDIGGNIDEFLKSIRHKPIKDTQRELTNTPKVVKLLSKSKQEEYKKLKQILNHKNDELQKATNKLMHLKKSFKNLGRETVKSLTTGSKDKIYLEKNIENTNPLQTNVENRIPMQTEGCSTISSVINVEEDINPIEISDSYRTASEINVDNEIKSEIRNALRFNSEINVDNQINSVIDIGARFNSEGNVDNQLNSEIDIGARFDSEINIEDRIITEIAIVQKDTFEKNEDCNSSEKDEDRNILETNENRNILENYENRNILENDENINILENDENRNILENNEDKNILETNVKDSFEMYDENEMIVLDEYTLEDKAESSSESSDDESTSHSSDSSSSGDSSDEDDNHESIEHYLRQKLLTNRQNLGQPSYLKQSKEDISFKILKEIEDFISNDYTPKDIASEDRLIQDNLNDNSENILDKIEDDLKEENAAITPIQIEDDLKEENAAITPIQIEDDLKKENVAITSIQIEDDLKEENAAITPIQIEDDLRKENAIAQIHSSIDIEALDNHNIDNSTKLFTSEIIIDPMGSIINADNNSKNSESSSCNKIAEITYNTDVNIRNNFDNTDLEMCALSNKDVNENTYRPLLDPKYWKSEVKDLCDDGNNVPRDNIDCTSHRTNTPVHNERNNVPRDNIDATFELRDDIECDNDKNVPQDNEYNDVGTSVARDNNDYTYHRRIIPQDSTRVHGKNCKKRLPIVSKNSASASVVQRNRLLMKIREEYAKEYVSKNILNKQISKLMAEATREVTIRKSVLNKISKLYLLLDKFQQEEKERALLVKNKIQIILKLQQNVEENNRKLIELQNYENQVALSKSFPSEKLNQNIKLETQKKQLMAQIKYLEQSLKDKKATEEPISQITSTSSTLSKKYEPNIKIISISKKNESNIIPTSSTLKKTNDLNRNLTTSYLVPQNKIVSTSIHPSTSFIKTKKFKLDNRILKNVEKHEQDAQHATPSIARKKCQPIKRNLSDQDILCHYDLLGRCNDDQCLYRHIYASNKDEPKDNKTINSGGDVKSKNGDNEEKIPHDSLDYTSNRSKKDNVKNLSKILNYGEKLEEKPLSDNCSELRKDHPFIIRKENLSTLECHEEVNVKSDTSIRIISSQSNKEYSSNEVSELPSSQDRTLIYNPEQFCEKESEHNEMFLQGDGENIQDSAIKTDDHVFGKEYVILNRLPTITTFPLEIEYTQIDSRCMDNRENIYYPTKDLNDEQSNIVKEDNLSEDVEESCTDIQEIGPPEYSSVNKNKNTVKYCKRKNENDALGQSIKKLKRKNVRSEMIEKLSSEQTQNEKDSNQLKIEQQSVKKEASKKRMLKKGKSQQMKSKRLATRQQDTKKISSHQHLIDKHGSEKQKLKQVSTRQRGMKKISREQKKIKRVNSRRQKNKKFISEQRSQMVSSEQQDIKNISSGEHPIRASTRLKIKKKK